MWSKTEIQTTLFIFSVLRRSQNQGQGLETTWLVVELCQKGTNLSICQTCIVDCSCRSVHGMIEIFFHTAEYKLLIIDYKLMNQAHCDISEAQKSYQVDLDVNVVVIIMAVLFWPLQKINFCEVAVTKMWKGHYLNQVELARSPHREMDLDYLIMYALNSCILSSSWSECFVEANFLWHESVSDDKIDRGIEH